MEDFLERFNYIFQKYKYNTLLEDVVRTLFLKGILEEYIEILNLMAVGDIYHKSFDEICELCRKYSSSRATWGLHLVKPCHSSFIHGILKNTPNFTTYQ